MVASKACGCILALSLTGCYLMNAGNVAFGQLSTADPYQAARERLVNDVIAPGGVKDPRVLRAIGMTPRHEFVDRSQIDQAYFDKALPIGEAQTISSPLIVAMMTEILDPKPSDKVLEIGTGSGYQAAVLSPLAKEVYTIEIVESLGKNADKVLKRLNYSNVHVRIGDGYKGWAEHAPFDKIIVTCSPEKVPQPLHDQLAEGGLMVIPVGERYQQMLYLMRKKDGKLEREAIRPTLFVPMTGTAEEQRQVKADPSKPKLLNGDFEQPLIGDGHVPGWYYQENLTWVEDSSAPSGKHVVEFKNEAAQRASHLLQGLGLDGRQVRRVKLGASIRTQNVKAGGAVDELPAVSIQFLDENRSIVGVEWLGPYRGTNGWKHDTRTISVPTESREAIVRIGLFGATGMARFDNVTLEAVAR